MCVSVNVYVCVRVCVTVCVRESVCVRVCVSVNDFANTDCLLLSHFITVLDSPYSLSFPILSLFMILLFLCSLPLSLPLSFLSFSLHLSLFSS